MLVESAGARVTNASGLYIVVPGVRYSWQYSRTVMQCYYVHVDWLDNDIYMYFESGIGIG